VYEPRHFEQHDPQALQALMREHPLATLVTQSADGSLEANPVPLLYDPAAGPHGTLRGHVARANPLWRDTLAGSQALAVFQGPEAYVSPSWYPSKREHGKMVPTWNYAVVQARGPLVIHDDAQWLRGFLQQLTAAHESGRPEPWAMADAPADFIEQTLKAIVGIEMPLTRLTGKWKVSQNRSAADRAGVAAGLEAEGSPAAQAMALLVRQTSG